MEQGKLNSKTIIIGIVSFVALTVGLTVLIEAVGAQKIRDFIESAGPLAPLAYLGIRAATFVIAPLSSGPVQFIAGTMFGLWQGLLLSMLGEAIGGSLNFWIARLLGRPVVARFVGRDGMGRVEQFYQQAGNMWTLVYARLFFFAVYDFISYAAGLTQMKYRTYLAVTVIAGFVPTFIAVAVGDSLTGNPGQMALLYAGLGVVCVLTVLAYNAIRRMAKAKEI